MALDPEAVRRMVVAALEATHDFGPEPWPQVVNDVIDSVTARIVDAEGREGIKSEMAGAYQVTYDSGSSAALLPYEEAALSPWRLARAGTVDVPSHAAWVHGDDASWWFDL